MATQKLIDNVHFEEVCKDGRGEYEKVNHRMFVLRPADRKFMQLCSHYGMSIRHIAQVTGLDTKAVTRRVSRIKKLLLNRKFLLLYADKEKLSGKEKDLAYDHIVNSFGYRKLAAKYKISEYEAREFIGKVRKMANVKSGK